MSQANDSDSDRSGRSGTSSAHTDTSAMTVASATTADQKTSSYIFLGETTCRFAYRSSTKAHKARTIVCGRSALGSVGCKCTTHRNKDPSKYRPVGYYYRVPLQSGGIICGLDCDEPITAASYRLMETREAEERARDLAEAAKEIPGWNDSDDSLDLDDSGYERTSTSRQPRVAIDPAANVIHDVTESAAKSAPKSSKSPTRPASALQQITNISFFFFLFL
eukprot:scaffold18327_cov44-Cyclotella_meneghiniana.AAC.3